MKAINGYSEAQATAFGDYERLPAGGYIIQINNVREENYSWGDVIVLAFDIAMGEHKGYYQNQYNNSTDSSKKWKGTHRINIPSPKSNSDEDVKKYNRSLGFFKAQIEAIEQSNNIKIDCSKEWDINILKGKKVGALFCNKEWEMDGKTGWYTALDYLTASEKIKSGDFKIPNDKPLKNKSTGATGIIQSAADAGIQTGDLSDFEEILADGAVPF